MKKRDIKLVAVFLYVLFIFSNSMRTAEVSSVESGTVLVVVQRFLMAIGLDNIGVTEHIIRKIAHFSEYTLLGILILNCLRGYHLPLERQIFFNIILGFTVPFLDETIQLFVEGRSGQLSDVWLDCAGVAFGVLILAFQNAILQTGKKVGAKKSDKKL